jgi:hypothetical protein
MVSICRTNEAECKRVTAALDAGAVAKLYGDADGNGIFGAVAPGRYVMLTSATYLNGLHIWTQSVDLADGLNSIVVSPPK